VRETDKIKNQGRFLCKDIWTTFLKNLRNFSVFLGISSVIKALA